MSSRKLTVQLGVCRRMKKETEYYGKEVEENEARVQKMRDEARDEYDIRKQEEVLGESRMMIPDSGRRLSEALQKLVDCLREADDLDSGDSTVQQVHEFLSSFPLYAEQLEAKPEG